MKWEIVSKHFVAQCSNFAVQFVLSSVLYCTGGKSGQRRAPCYLTGRQCICKGALTESVTETKPSVFWRIRVKKRGKSPLVLL